MEKNTIEKTMDIAGSAMKIAANLTEAKKEAPKPQPFHQTDDNSNKASTGSQTVVVSMDGNKDKEQDKVEKHIHEFPENRSLTTEECDLALKKAQMDYELKKATQEYLQKDIDREWQHKLEQEKKDEKKGKVRRIIGGILVALGASAIGYSIYADYRDHKNMPAPVETKPVTTEETTK